MIFVDTNVFVIALRYPRDPNAAANARFLEGLRKGGNGATSILNVLETCGILSFNLNGRQLRALYAYFGKRFGIEVLPRDTAAGLVPADAEDLLRYVTRRMSFGDALVAQAVDLRASDTSAFVSWDARHFRGKITATALTPAEFLEGDRL